MTTSSLGRSGNSLAVDLICRAMDSISSNKVRNARTSYCAAASLWMLKMVESIVIVFCQSSVVYYTWRMLKGNCLPGT